MYPVSIYLQQTVSQHPSPRNRSLGPMTPWIVIIQIFVILAGASRPRILQPGQGTTFLTLQEHFEQAANISNTRIQSTKSQNVTASHRLPVLPVPFTNLTLNASIESLEAMRPACVPAELSSYESCRQALSLLPRDGRIATFGRFESRDFVTHVLPYAVTSCGYSLLRVQFRHEKHSGPGKTNLSIGA